LVDFVVFASCSVWLCPEFTQARLESITNGKVTINTMVVVSLHVFTSYTIETLDNQLFEFINGFIVLSVLAHVHFGLIEALFAGIQLGTVGRQVHHRYVVLCKKRTNVSQHIIGFMD
jgi:hypothetical protein